MNVAALSRHHGKTSVPMNRVLTFTDGSDKLNVRCYLHTDQHAPQGWHAPAARTVRLRMPFVAPVSRAVSPVA